MCLSRVEGESNSISNPKAMPTDYAKRHKYKNVRIFVDDSVSGVTVKRNGFQTMRALVEAGKASAVIVKGLPRLGRNYLEVVQAHGNCFLLHNVHFIAVNNGVDSEQGEDDFIPPFFHNIMNEWYAKDMSRKMRSSIRTKSKQGYAIGRPPLGYMHDAENPKLWYEKVLIPSIYAERKGFKKPIRRATRGE